MPTDKGRKIKLSLMPNSWLVLALIIFSIMIMIFSDLYAKHEQLTRSSKQSYRAVYSSFNHTLNRTYELRTNSSKLHFDPPKIVSESNKEMNYRDKKMNEFDQSRTPQYVPPLKFSSSGHYIPPKHIRTTSEIFLLNAMNVSEIDNISSKLISQKQNQSSIVNNTLKGTVFESLAQSSSTAPSHANTDVEKSNAKDIFVLEFKQIIDWKIVFKSFVDAINEAAVKGTYNESNSFEVHFDGVVVRNIPCPIEACPAIDTSFQPIQIREIGGLCGLTFSPALTEGMYDAYCFCFCFANV